MTTRQGLDGDRLWTHEETARWLHVSVWTLHHLVAGGDGPPVYLIARRARRYDPAEVRQWLRDHRVAARNVPVSIADEAPQSATGVTAPRGELHLIERADATSAEPMSTRQGLEAGADERTDR